MAKPEIVTRDEIKPQVIEKIRKVVKKGIEITEKSKLEKDLGMGSTLRAAMARPYKKISRKYGGSAILPDEAQALKDVKESITLVHNRANGRK